MVLRWLSTPLKDLNAFYTAQQTKHIREVTVISLLSMDEEIEIKECSPKIENESISTSGRTLTFSNGFKIWLRTPEFLPTEPEALRSTLESLHWGTHVLHYSLTLTRILSWPNYDSCRPLQEEYLVQVFKASAEWTTLHLQKKKEYRKGGVKCSWREEFLL